MRDYDLHALVNRYIVRSEERRVGKECWVNKNWHLICSLEDVIKSDENPKSHIGKERDNIWVYMLMDRTLGWALAYVD